MYYRCHRYHRRRTTPPYGCGGKFCVNKDGSISKVPNSYGTCDIGWTLYDKPFVNTGGYATGCFQCPDLKGGWPNSTPDESPIAFSCLRHACGKVPDTIPSGWCTTPTWDCKCSSLFTT